MPLSLRGGLGLRDGTREVPKFADLRHSFISSYDIRFNNLKTTMNYNEDHVITSSKIRFSSHHIPSPGSYLRQRSQMGSVLVN